MVSEIRPCPRPPLWGDKQVTHGSMNKTSLCSLCPLWHLSLTSTSISQNSTPHPCLKAGNERVPEWISSGMTTARWHLSLFCFLPPCSILHTSLLLCLSPRFRPGATSLSQATHTHTLDSYSSLSNVVQSNRWSFILSTQLDYGLFAQPAELKNKYFKV